ncbi:MAG: sigma-70 family RNA polymerase sigma factor [Anaerolineae bacterium]|nr:sigma-70 family RNA polymerase sigma factor [Anaerolineae bacterium]
MRWLEPSDNNLIGRIAHGDEAALEQLYRKHSHRLLGYLTQQLDDPQLAEEALQDVMVEVWKGAKRFRGESSVQTWLFSIARYRAIRMRKSRRPSAYSIDDDFSLTSDSETPFELMVSGMQSAQVKQAIAKLSLEHREVLDMVYYDERSSQETADLLGIPLGTLKSRLSRAKTALRRILQSAILLLVAVCAGLVIYLGQKPDEPSIFFLPTPSPTPTPTATAERTPQTTMLIATPTQTMTPAPTQTPAVLTPPPYLLAYSHYIEDDNTDIFTMNTAGEAVQNLTQHPGFDNDASWSPDGTQIVFTSQRDGGNSDLYIMDADGGNVRQLTNDPAQVELYPTWSPDGQTIAFTSVSFNDLGVPAIYLINADGSNLRPITNGANFRGTAPVWIEGGTRLLFLRAERDDERNMRVYVMDADGSDVEPFLSDLFLTDDDLFAGEMRVSPDGRYLAYREFEQVSENESEGDRIMIYDFETQTKRPLIDLQQPHFMPDWSPDSQWIVFTQIEDFNAPRADICLVHISGEGYRCLTETGQNYGARFKP